MGQGQSVMAATESDIVIDGLREAVGGASWRGSSAPLRVLVIGDAFSFPNGQGATARVHAVARGLHEAGCQVRIVVTRASERPSALILNPEARGVVSGVRYEYAAGSSQRSPTFLGRRKAEVCGLLRAAVLAAHGCDAMLVYTVDSISIPLFVGFIARLRGASIVKDSCELPFVYARSDGLRRRYQDWYTRAVQSRYDGIFVISAYLDSYYERISRGRARRLLVPILVDVDEFAAASSATPSVPKMVLYAGDLGHTGEVEGLLRIFSRVIHRHPDARLTVLGDRPGTSRREDLLREADRLGVAGAVDFLGLVPRQSVPRHFSHAAVLVLPRAAGAFSTAGLPTKLAEYLATGRPVIVSAVGDIPRYLQDRVDAFLVPPGHDEEFESTLNWVLDNPSEASLIGSRGRELAKREFDYSNHGRRIVRFLRELRSSGALGKDELLGGRTYV